MSAVPNFSNLFGINNQMFSKEEKIILEAKLYVHLYHELEQFFRKEHQNYFRLVNFTLEMEHIMLEENFLRLIVNDILSTGDYTLEGIASYTDTHEDVLHEVISGRNKYPSAIFFRKAVGLHQSVRRELYQSIFKKITMQYLEVA